MKKTFKNNNLLSYENTLYDELCSLNSILKLTKNSCLEQESNSNYYNLNGTEKIMLSEERNHYLNLLTIAIDKISLLKSINKNIENEIYTL